MKNLYPAIDIKEGACVRLLYGEMDTAKHYNSDPKAQAEQFLKAGCKWVHVVDLDGAIAGEAVNRKAIEGILEVGLMVQLGGGIRSMGAVEDWLSLGVERVILGTVALKNPNLVKDAAKAFPHKIVVAADAKDGMVKSEGWVEDSKISVKDLAKRFEDCGVEALIFTDIGRDGALKGVNLNATSSLAKATSLSVIASGGVKGIEDIRLLAEDDSGIEGVIVGRAFYDGKISLKEALSLLEASPC